MEISFVIPAHNEERRIAECLRSVEKELVRTPCEAEVIVVNNASSDRTGEIARSFADVRVVDEPVKGLVAARQAGYAASRGELVANIDADTIVPPGWLARALTEFRTDTNLVALSGPYIYYDLPAWKRALVKTWYFPGWLFDRFYQPLTGRATMLQGGNFVVRRSAWDRAGGFDTSIAFYGEDADVARRISAYGRVRWTWSFYIYASGRRLAREGLLKTARNYAIGIFVTHMSGRAPARRYTDIR